MARQLISISFAIGHSRLSLRESSVGIGFFYTFAERKETIFFYFRGAKGDYFFNTFAERKETIFISLGL